MANVTLLGDIEEIVGVVCAGLGAIPLALTIVRTESTLALASALVTLSGLFHSSSNTSVVSTRVAVEVIDSVVAVLFTLIICIRIGTHRTIVGTLRTLWVIAIVTSSSSYVSIRELAPDDFAFIPNDLTIVSLGVACLLLFSTYIVSRRYRIEYIRDTRIIFAESILVLGSFALRFEKDIAHVIRVQIGWPIWYIACHATTLLSFYIVRHPRSTEIVIDARLSSL